MKRGRVWVSSLLGAGLVATAIAASASAQTVPTARDQVARPGGQVAGLPPLALVKVADGFNDPVGVASANDGSGRIFVVERIGRIIGAMQSFRDRLTQDEILRVSAYVRSLRGDGS